MQRAVAHRTRVKKEPLDKEDPPSSPPEIICVEDDENNKDKEITKKTQVTKNVKVCIETLKLRPVMPVGMSHPQTAKRSRGFHPRWTKVGWVGKKSDNDTENNDAPAYNELEAAKSLVGLKEAQPKMESICNLRSRATTVKQDSPKHPVNKENASTEQQENTKNIRKLTSQEKEQNKDGVVAEVNTNTKKAKCTSKLKLKRVKSIREKRDEKEISVEEKFGDKSDKGVPESNVSQTSEVEQPTVDIVQMHSQVQALLQDEKGYAEYKNR